MVDNFDLIIPHMSFDSNDEFYFVQAFVRGKDGRENNVDGSKIGGNNKNRLVRIWTIRSVEELLRAKSDIIEICKSVNARAYIHPTKRSFKSVATEALKLSVDSFTSENYQGLKGVYSSACGISYLKNDKKFVIDLDGYFADKEDEIINYIEKYCYPLHTQKYLYTVPTVHGKHLITKPFDIIPFSQKYPEIDIHKNNPTLLYYYGEK